MRAGAWGVGKLYLAIKTGRTKDMSVRRFLRREAAFPSMQLYKYNSALIESYAHQTSINSESAPN